VRDLLLERELALPIVGAFAQHECLDHPRERVADNSACGTAIGSCGAPPADDMQRQAVIPPSQSSRPEGDGVKRSSWSVIRRAPVPGGFPSRSTYAERVPVRSKEWCARSGFGGHGRIAGVRAPSRETPTIYFEFRHVAMPAERGCPLVFGTHRMLYALGREVCEICNPLRAVARGTQGSAAPRSTGGG